MNDREALSHEDADTRAKAAVFLGKIGPDAKEALPALRWLLLDEDQLVRRAAEEAIKNAKSEIDLAKATSELAVMAAQIAALRKYRDKK